MDVRWTRDGLRAPRLGARRGPRVSLASTSWSLTGARVQVSSVASAASANAAASSMLIPAPRAQASANSLGSISCSSRAPGGAPGRDVGGRPLDARLGPDPFEGPQELDRGVGFGCAPGSPRTR